MIELICSNQKIKTAFGCYVDKELLFTFNIAKTESDLDLNCE